MSLPNLNNDVPRYELTVPSTQEVVKYRPFLVKEQKVLMIAYESQEPKQIIDAMLGCIENCVNDLKVKDLATFDVDYIFTQIRSKSVGETSKIVVKCKSCEADNEVIVNLSEIGRNIKYPETLIPLTETVNIQMRYPTYFDLMENEIMFTENPSVTDILFENLYTCLHSVKTEEENITIKDEPKEEIINFINNMTNEQLEKLQSFVQDLPSLKEQVKFKCKECESDEKIELQGLQDFF